MFGKRTWRLALPIPWLVTLAVALVVLFALTSIYGPTSTVLIGWLIGWLIVSRIVNYIVSRRRPKRSGD
ncbi:MULTISPECIES: hypothetical protein [unclassified Phenylobacterium]|uniref:hypothetical protein n=1 Tax=unclassified Phenylobacterium TaxID=2640670 RepID=UPI00083AA229|nr:MULTISPECIES: hypothetical protein [unclassified Phenylobacterium]